jgi:pectate lyase
VATGPASLWSGPSRLTFPGAGGRDRDEIHRRLSIDPPSRRSEKCIVKHAQLTSFESRLRLALIGVSAAVVAAAVAITANISLSDRDAPLASLPSPWSPPPSAPSVAEPSAGPSIPASPGSARPKPGTTKLSATRRITGRFDGRNGTFVGAGDLGDGGSDEDQAPLFELTDGATMSNVVIGAPAADGVHCTGSCTLRNVWWLDVGEDAATFDGTSAAQTMSVIGGGARHAADIVFQHNGPGTFLITGFEAEDIGRLYRSCGDCADQFRRTAELTDITVTAPLRALVGINPNLGDTATISRATLIGATDKNICALYKGVTDGDPTQVSNVPDNDACTATDITLN